LFGSYDGLETVGIAWLADKWGMLYGENNELGLRVWINDVPSKIFPKGCSRKQGIFLRYSPISQEYS